MSSNHTRVNCEQWNQIKREIRQAEAYVINAELEVKRLKDLAKQRREKRLQLEEDSRRVVNESIENLQRMYSEGAQTLQNEMHAGVQAGKDSFIGQVTAIRSDITAIGAKIVEFDARINSVAGEFAEMLRGVSLQIADLQDRCRYDMKQLENLMNNIVELHPERFAPDAYNRIVESVRMIHDNNETGNYQAALMVTQTAIMNASTLLVRLIALNEQYNARYAQVTERATALMERVDALSSKDGKLVVGDQEYDYDISFWSNRRFDDIADAIRSHNEDLENNVMNLEQLEQIAANIPVLEHNLEVCDTEARLERASAIAVADTCIHLADSMTEEGWILSEGDYEEQDERNPYVMNFENGSGSIATIIVTPETPEIATVSTEVFSPDPDLAEDTKRGVLSTLNMDDFRTGPVEYRDDCHLNPDPDTFVDNVLDEMRQELEERRGQLKR